MCNNYQPYYILSILAELRIRTVVEPVAGREVTDSEGRPLSFSLGRTVGVGELFASNGTIHRQILEAIQALRSAS